MWLLGSFAVLSLLYRTQAPTSATQAPAGAEDPPARAEQLSKRERTRQAYAHLVAADTPMTGARLAEAAGVSPSYGRALLAEFQTDLPWPTRRPTGNGPTRRWGSGDQDHLAELP